MKKILLSALVGALASVSGLNVAKADCGPNVAPEVGVAMAYLSIVENRGPFGEPGGFPTEGELCKDLVSWNFSLQDDGYTDYVLVFKDRSCEFLIQRMPGGKVGDIRLSGCKE